MNVFWFRRDLRLTDNIGLQQAIEAGSPLLLIFIFDELILDELPKNDPRVNFIYDELKRLNLTLNKIKSSLLVFKGEPKYVWQNLISRYPIKKVFINRDYEPYAIKRDKEIGLLLKSNNIVLESFKDQVIFEPSEVLKADKKPYTVYTPFKNKWLSLYQPVKSLHTPDFKKLYQELHHFPSKLELGIQNSSIKVKPFTLKKIDNYENERDFPALNSTSYLGVHLRFGTVSVREIISQLGPNHTVFLSELIWREFFMQILFYFPQVVSNNFKKKYDKIEWVNNEDDFEKWKQGKTGYPMVDAGMRQLNSTGYMHNRVRMVVAGFLCKHLLIDWRWGEAYFASKLLDYELAANNGNWQWAAGTGCDSAPYFRIFNPASQLKKFDNQGDYIKQWIPEFDSLEYPKKMIDHTFARKRALSYYKLGLEKY